MGILRWVPVSRALHWVLTNARKALTIERALVILLHIVPVVVRGETALRLHVAFMRARVPATIPTSMMRRVYLVPKVRRFGMLILRAHVVRVILGCSSNKIICRP